VLISRPDSKYSLKSFSPRTLSGDPDQEYFVDETTDEIIT
jgi:hypothetical protein